MGGLLPEVWFQTPHEFQCQKTWSTMHNIKKKKKLEELDLGVSAGRGEDKE